MTLQNIIDHARENKTCAACGSEAEVKYGSGCEILQCKATGQFAWSCLNNEHLFHHHEAYPTIGHVACPIVGCGSDIGPAAHELK